MKFTQEQIQKAAGCKSVEELIELARAKTRDWRGWI